MSVSAAHAKAFYQEVIAEAAVWTVRDSGGIPAPKNGEGRRSMPFWSKASRAGKIVAGVPAYSHFELQQIPIDEFIDRWLPGLAKDGLLIGLNWSGENAVGYDLEPELVLQRLKMK